MLHNVYCEDFTADPWVNAVCRHRGASLCFPMEISLTSPISAPRNLHLCPMPTSNLLQCSPHAALPLQHMQVAALQRKHKIARGRWHGDGSLGSWNGSGWFWICRADLKFSHSCKVWDYNLVALCSLQVQTSSDPGWSWRTSRAWASKSDYLPAALLIPDLHPWFKQCFKNVADTADVGVIFFDRSTRSS